MDTSLTQGSATIYQFPVRVRTTAGVQHDDATIVQLHKPRLPKMTFGTAWYHDDAVQEADLASNH